VKWPLVTRSRYEHDLAELNAKVNAEYKRAQIEVGNQVRQWATDANYNIFNADSSRQPALIYAALQDAVGRFSNTLVRRNNEGTPSVR
jgi:hypothetical protein